MSSPHGLRMLGLVVCAWALWLAACASQDPGPSSGRPGGAAPRVETPPQWRPGDRWVYDWKAGEQTGSKTTEVVEIKPVRGVQYYVLKMGDDLLYFTLDLSWAFIVRESKVQVRMVPPQPWFTWPLETGRSWTHSGTFEDEKAKRQLNDRYGVVAREQIEVPAGRFTAFKVVREGAGRDGDQYWYVPEVRFYAKWVGRRGGVEFEETLREFNAAPRPLLPPPAAPSPVPR